MGGERVRLRLFTSYSVTLVDLEQDSNANTTQEWVQGSITASLIHFSQSSWPGEDLLTLSCNITNSFPRLYIQSEIPDDASTHTLIPTHI